MYNTLVIIGAGGHGKVVADMALKIGYTDIVFADDHATGTCMGLPVRYTCRDLLSLNDGKTDFVIAVGSNAARKAIAERYPVNYVTLVHPSAELGACVTVGTGTVIMANAVINPCATVGKHCIINTAAVVEHDNTIGDYVHLSPRVALGGTVSVGEETHVGIGATVKNNITICGHCVIGAGAAVVKNIYESSIYMGIPAKKHQKIGGGVTPNYFSKSLFIRRCVA